MYFLSQIQKQFFAQICLYADWIEEKSPTNTQETSPSTEPWNSEKFGVSKEAFQKLTEEKQKKLQTLFDQLSSLEKDVVDNNIDKRFLTTGATILARIQTDPSYKPTDSEDTKAYQELLDKLKSYQERIWKIETDNKQKAEQISMLNMEISKILGTIPTQTSQWEKEGTEKITEGTEKFREYLSKREKEAGLAEWDLLVALGKKYDYSGIVDDEGEAKIAEDFLKNPDNFKKEVDALITEMKGKAITFEKGIDVENPEKAAAQLMFLQKNNPTGWMDDVEQQAKKNYKSLDDGTIGGKILEFLRKLFGIDIHDDGVFSTYGGSKEAVGNLIGGEWMYELGSLSKFYESGNKGPQAINGDDRGKPSFGTYQLRADFLKQFADSLWIVWNHEEVFASWATSEFAENWKKKVAEIWEEKFQKMEHEFIKKTHYDKVAASAGFDVSKSSIVVQNVIWSTAVQHGPGTDIIQKAVQETNGFTPWDINSEKSFIEKVYEIRLRAYPWGKERYSKELNMALSQLNTLPSGVADIPVGDIQSVQKEVLRNPDGSVKMTYCARTARKNAIRFGVNVPQEESARGLENLYKQQWKLAESPTGNIFQIFSGSKRFPNYWHVATGFVREWQAFVLDPYLPVTGTYTHNAIPLERYVSYLKSSGRGMRGVANIG